jgi:LysM repeat protein
MKTGQSEFEVYLRTGIRARPEIERKFNPWHDPEDGRFTFVGQGQYFGRSSLTPGYGPVVDQRPVAGGGETGMARRPSMPVARPAPAAPPRRDATGTVPSADPKHPSNYSVYTVRRGDSLASIARKRKGLRASDLAWLNDIAIDRPILIGQSLKLPTQSSLDAGREAKNRFLALSYYMDRHGGALPPNPARPPSLESQILDYGWRRVSKNGYDFYIDAAGRTREVQGNLTLAPTQRRSRRSQREAGGTDRRPKDQGGHYIARRFNGPLERFNHFAQDGSFNNGEYRRLENIWAAEIGRGRLVTVSITPEYEGVSQRPYAIRIIYRVDGRRERTRFLNSSRRN